MKNSYGILKQSIQESNDNLHLENFARNGFTVFDSMLESNKIDELCVELDQIYEAQKISFNQGLELINEENIARSLLNYSKLFLEYATDSRLLSFMSFLLGEYFIIHLQNGVINKPSNQHHQSKWHRDIPYQNFTSSKPLAISAFLCLDDFTKENGGTVLLPYSQKFDEFPSDQYLEANELHIQVPKGSVIIFDSMLFHRSGYNNSDHDRRGVNTVFSRPFVKQQIEFELQYSIKMNKSLNRILGFDSNTAKSVDDFRVKRLNRKNEVD
jgi:ectoine hydroxylase-related dioxygenase (phytanoyl-CoA dioxygenase family)